MSEEAKTKNRSVRGRRKKTVSICACNEDGYRSFALLRNDGVLPLKSANGVAVVECRKSKCIASSQVLYKSLLESSEQVAYVSHILGQKSPKQAVKVTLKKLKKNPIVILYIRNEAKSELAEIEQLASLIKKHSVLILCYHKTGSLLSSSLISCASAVFACFNKDKEEAKALCNLILGNSSPYARVNIEARTPFTYEYLFEGGTGYYAFMGHGLSYVNFSYTNVSLSYYNAKVGEKIEAKAVITNISEINASELVQLYVTPVQNYSPMLIDCRKINIPARESMGVSFELDTSKLDYSSFEDNEAYDFYVCVGKSSTDVIRIPFRVIC